ncbi:MAG: CmcI family methyltransferase [Ferrovibrio sp.]|uniref:CmcI family methyltransferase n=1 Tax=Ferrovibrio sp. TaxID=1917215 RepID=UPI00391D9268
MSIPVGDAYLQWFYNNHIWKNMQYKGVRTLKLPSDMWNYQEIIHERRIRFVVETGTRHGGSALFFADHVALYDGFVITCDIHNAERQVKSHPRIHFLMGNTASLKTVEMVATLLPADRKPGETFFIFDSDHSAQHVLAELEAFKTIFLPGDTVIVEDSCVNGHPVRPEHGPGPMEAILAFRAQYPDVLEPDGQREEKFGTTMAPRGYFRAKAAPAAG